ncbi:hypothetical protein [Agromyces sp. NPDC055658]
MIVIVIVFAIATAPLSAPSIAFADGPGTCSETEIGLGLCEPLVTTPESGRVDLGVGISSGTPGDGLNGAGDRNGSDAGGYAEDDPGPRGSIDVWSGDNWQQLCGANFEGDCSRLNEPAPPPTPPRPGGPVVVTLRDIASFRPTPPVSVMEPNGWAVVGVPANFVAEASSEVVSGILLGRTAEVRFTPVGYRWSHRDGAVVESASPGASWTDLGVAEFTPTGTSHVYAERGEYTVTLEVVLSAEYRFGGSGWQSIAGVLAVAGDPVPVLVGEVDTVLTNGDCRANPSGPGC